MKKITPCLWFDDEAEDAAKFYISIFKNSKIGHIEKYNVETPSDKPIGSVMTVTYYLNGHEFMNLNGGKFFKINPSISFTIVCKTKEETRNLWNKLKENGSELMPLDSYPFSEMYGWLKDKYGVTWQLIYVKDAQKDQEIIPFLLFTQDVCGKGEEAINFYTKVFDNSSIGEINRYPPGRAPEKEGTIEHADFIISGNKFMICESALDHKFNFDEAISFIITCENQEEIDYFYEHLSAYPESEVCGWLKDKYGVSWQLITKDFEKLLKNANPDKAKKIMKALLEMKRIDINELEKIN